MMSPHSLMMVGQQVLSKQAISEHFDTRLDRLDAGEAELSMPITAVIRQQHGFVHGGIVSYLADNALTFAGGSVLGDSVTVEYKINYLKPAKGSSRLRAVAKVIGHGKSNAVCACEVFDETLDGPILVAVAQGTIQAVKAVAK